MKNLKLVIIVVAIIMFGGVLYNLIENYIFMDTHIMVLHVIALILINDVIDLQIDKK